MSTTPPWTHRTAPVFPTVGILGLGSGSETVAARCAVCQQRLDAQRPHLLRRALEAHADTEHLHGVPGLYDAMRLVPLAPVVAVGAA